MITAREINRVLREHGSLSVNDLAADSPVAVAAWRTEDEAIQILVGEVDEGFRDTTDGTWPVSVSVPGIAAPLEAHLSYGESRLFKVTASGTTDSWA